MKLTIESTEKITSLDGVPVRLWRGTTGRGTPVLVFVHRLSVHETHDGAEFESELQETVQPGQVIAFRKVMDDEEEFSRS